MLAADQMIRNLSMKIGEVDVAQVNLKSTTSQPQVNLTNFNA